MNSNELKQLKDVFDTFEEMETDLESIKSDVEDQMNEASSASDTFSDIARSLDYAKDNMDTLTTKINEMRAIVYKILAANVMTCTNCGHANCFD